MRVTRSDTRWILHPTTPKEEGIFAVIAQHTPVGKKIHLLDKDYSEDGRLASALISVGGEFSMYQSQRNPNTTLCTWIGGIVIPFVVPDDGVVRDMLRTMSTSGLVYTGFTDGALEAYGLKCRHCQCEMIDPRECSSEICTTCAVACEHEIWEPGHFVQTADGGIAMGEQCVHCKLTRGPATDARDEVERTTGILIIGPADDIMEAVDTILLAEPDFD